jgi:hypothetical protein
MSQHPINCQERICVLIPDFFQKEIVIPTIINVIQLPLAVAPSIGPAD